MRRSVSVVFQEPLLLNTSVYKNVALGLKFRHLTGSEIEKSVDESLDYFGISSLAKRSAKTLSGGEAKRVSLARAFALKPELIMMDEAFNSLDPPTRETLIDDLRHILEETKITAVLALHDREETLRLAQDVALWPEAKLFNREQQLKYLISRTPNLWPTLSARKQYWKELSKAAMRALWKFP